MARTFSAAAAFFAGLRQKKGAGLPAPCRLDESRISEAGVRVGRQLLAVPFERERDPGAVAQMRYAHHVDRAGELVEIEEFFLALHIEGREAALAVVEIGVGDRGVEAALPGRALRRDVETGPLPERHLAAVAYAHRQLVWIEIVDLAQRYLAARQTVDVAHQRGGREPERVVHDRRIEIRLAHLDLVRHGATVDALQADAVHQAEAFLAHRPRVVIVLGKGDFEWRVAAEQL